MNDERINERRKQLGVRLMTARVYLMITEGITIIGLLGIIINFTWITLPYGFFIPQYAVMLIRDNGFAEGVVRPGLIALGSTVAAGMLIFYLIAMFAMKKSKVWMNAVIVAFSIDTVVLFMITLFSVFGTGLSALLSYLVNAALHVYVLVGLLSARKAQRGLEVLPDKEDDYGDPYEEFRRKDEE